MFSRTRRKRKKSNNLNKKTIILSCCFIISIIILYFLISFVSKKITTKYNFENDIASSYEEISDNTFSIDKIVLYSSASGVSNETSRDLWNLNIYQFTDIAIYFKNTDNFNSKNTIKNLYINNVNFTTSPERGNPSLYYKDIKDFATPEYISENKIEDAKEFNIIDSDDEIDTSKPDFYNTYQTPLTLSFVNENIKENAIIPNTNTPLEFNGSLLSKSNISLNSISCSLSFDINIVNNLDEKFVNRVNISIPLQDEGNNIYNGFIKKNLTNIPNSNFFKLKEIE